MAGLLRDDFSPKRPITQVPTAWFNAVAKILNGITAGVGININKNGTDTAGWEFELDLEFARKYLGIEGGGGKPTDLTHEDITDWDDATADFLTQGDLDGYATEADVDAVSDLMLDLTDVVDGILADYVSTDDLTTTLSFYSNTETIANTYATKTALSAVDDDLTALAQIVEDMDADLADLLDWADALDADLYDAQGAKKWVDTTTNQTINGTKSFTSTVFIRTAATQYFEIENTTNSTRGYFGLGEIWLDKNAGQIPIHFRDFDRTEKARIYYDYTDNALKLLAYKPDGGWGPANKVCLGVAPTDTSATNDNGIATLGWVNNYFSRKTHHHDDVYAKISHTHSGYATTNHTHSGYASSNHNHAGVYAPAQHQHVAADITDLGTAIDGKITTFSNTVSTTYATKTALNGVELDVQAIDADLALLELDVQDISDYLETCLTDDDLPAAFITAVASRKTLSNMKVITDLQWTGTALQYKSRSVSYSNGLLTVTGSESSWTTLDTPTVISWS